MRNFCVFAMEREWKRLPQNLPIITLLTIHCLRSLWGICSDHIDSTLVTLSLIQFPWVTECHTIQVSLIWVTTRDRQAMFPIELQFLSYDPKRTTRHFTLYCPIQDIIRNRVYSIRKLRCRDRFLYSREWSLIVTPVESLTSHCLTFWERKILIRLCFVVSIRTHRTRKELSPLSIYHHPLYNLRNQLFILFLAILLVEDAVGFIMESNATKTMIKIDASFGIIAVPEFCIIETEWCIIWLIVRTTLIWEYS